jgi:hypothetical protein
MKFYIRRAVLGVVATPIMAGAYFLIYALLIGAGGTPTSTPQEVFSNGLWIGAFISVAFTFYPQVRMLERAIDRKIFGEEE